MGDPIGDLGGVYEGIVASEGLCRNSRGSYWGFGVFMRGLWPVRGSGGDGGVLIGDLGWGWGVMRALCPVRGPRGDWRGSYKGFRDV